jgi:hypothetical protein
MDPPLKHHHPVLRPVFMIEEDNPALAGKIFADHESPASVAARLVTEDTIRADVVVLPRR